MAVKPQQKMYVLLHRGQNETHFRIPAVWPLAKVCAIKKALEGPGATAIKKLASKKETKKIRVYHDQP